VDNPFISLENENKSMRFKIFSELYLPQGLWGEMGDGVPHRISIKRLGWKSFYGGFNKLSNKTGEL